jgi:hypothetical protein
MQRSECILNLQVFAAAPLQIPQGSAFDLPGDLMLDTSAASVTTDFRDAGR